MWFKFITPVTMHYQILVSRFKWIFCLSRCLQFDSFDNLSKLKLTKMPCVCHRSLLTTLFYIDTLSKRSYHARLNCLSQDLYYDITEYSSMSRLYYIICILAIKKKSLCTKNYVIKHFYKCSNFKKSHVVTGYEILYYFKFNVFDAGPEGGYFNISWTPKTIDPTRPIHIVGNFVSRKKIALVTFFNFCTRLNSLLVIAKVLQLLINYSHCNNF